MTKMLLAAAAFALLAAPALAADTMTNSAMDGKMEATMLCRPAMAKEKPTAMMGTKGIVCKTMAPMTSGGHMGPDTKGMDAAKTDAAWRAWLEQNLQVQSNTGTTGGNG